MQYYREILLYIYNIDVEYLIVFVLDVTKYHIPIYVLTKTHNYSLVRTKPEKDPNHAM